MPCYGASGYNESTSPFPCMKVSAATPGNCEGILVEPAGSAREHMKPAVVSPFNKNKKICSKASIPTASKTIFTLKNAGTTNIVI